MPPELPKVCSSSADCYKIQFAVTDASIAPALDAVVAFFDALRAEQWDAAADMVDADAAAAFRAAELASLTGWAQHRDAMIAARERGESMGWSSDGRLNQALLDQYRDTPIRGIPGAARQAVGAFAHVRAQAHDQPSVVLARASTVRGPAERATAEAGSHVDRQCSTGSHSRTGMAVSDVPAHARRAAARCNRLDDARGVQAKGRQHRVR